jgi:hypothetical protein
MSTDYIPWTPDEPVVTITVTPPDHLSVKMFGIDRPIPDPSLLRRDQMGRLMDCLYTLLTQPFTAQIIETDGSTQTGTIDLSTTSPQRGQRERVEQPDQPTANVDPVWGPPSADTAWHPPAQPPALPLAPAPAQPDQPGASLNVPVYAAGFQPGEEASIALVMSGTIANPQGMASFQIPRRVVESLPSREIIVFGRSSGTIAVRQPLTGL